MASIVDICNLALAHLGDEAAVASISPPDGSQQADHCARFYPIARDQLLEMHAWNFATTRIAPAELTTDRAGWGYAYQVPVQSLRILRALPEGASDDHRGVKFIVEANRIYTNEPVFELVYITRITDTTKYTPLFVVALSRLLASYLAGPVRRDTTGEAARQQYGIFLQEFRNAGGSNANQQNNKPDHRPLWLKARGDLRSEDAPISYGGS